ncbi:MAG: hypothetical protein WCJ58_00160 [bacterium]
MNKKNLIIIAVASLLVILSLGLALQRRISKRNQDTAAVNQAIDQVLNEKDEIPDLNIDNELTGTPAVSTTSTNANADSDIDQVLKYLESDVKQLDASSDFKDFGTVE